MKILSPDSLNSPNARIRHPRWRLAVALALVMNAAGLARAQSPSVSPPYDAYYPGEDIVFSFANGPGNPKDWIGIYEEGQIPGGPTSTLWAYVDGTQDGNTAKTDGTISFAQGLNAAGNYVAYFLLNDGYGIMASNAFKVVEIATQTPRLLSINPANNASNQPPIVPFVAAITNGSSKVASNSVVF